MGIGGVEVLSWGGANPQESLQGLLQVVERLLQPGLGDSASLYVGDLILQILQKMPAQVRHIASPPAFIWVVIIIIIEHILRGGPARYVHVQSTAPSVILHLSMP